MPSYTTNVATINQTSLLRPFLEQPRSTWIVVAYTRPALSVTSGHHQHVSKATSHEETSQNNFSSEVHGGGGLELVKLALEATSRHSALFIPENAPVILPVRHSLWAPVGRRQTVVIDQLYTQKSLGLRPWFISDATVSHFSVSSTIELPLTLAKYGAYSPYRTCHGTLAHAACPTRLSATVLPASCVPPRPEEHQIGA